MATLVLRLMSRPRLPGFERLATGCGVWLNAFIEAQEMARAAQQRFPFAVE